MFDVFTGLLRLAWRGIWRNRRRTLITVSSITFGMTLVIFFIAIGEGFYFRLIEDAIRMQSGHITVEHPGYRDAPSVDLMVPRAETLRRAAASLPQVAGTKLLVSAQGLVKTATGAVGAMVMGVEPGVEAGTSPLARNIIKGRYLEDHDGQWVVIGEGMAKRLNLGIGKKLVISANDKNGQLVEELCRVRGIFRLGSEEVDGYLVQVPIGFARKLFGLPREAATQVGIILRNPDDRRRLVPVVARLDGAQGCRVLVWEQVIPELAAYVSQDRVSNIVFQVLLVVLILFTIFNTLLMSVMERRREFAVLLALGTTPFRLKAQVFLEAVLIDILGCSLGLLAGCALTLVTGHFGIDLRALYGGDLSISGFATPPILYPGLNWFQLALILGIVFNMTIVFGIYPAWRAPRLKVAEVLR